MKTEGKRIVLTERAAKQIRTFMDELPEATYLRVRVADDKFKRLGWKKSASLVIVVVASRGDALAKGADDFADCAVGNQPALTDPVVIALPGGGSVVLKALDIKRDPSDTLTNAVR